MRSPRALLLLVPLVGVACGGGDDTVDAGAPTNDVTITSTKTAFDREAFAVRAGEQVVVTYDNRHGGVPHNISFDLGDEDPKTEVKPGPDEQTITFVVPTDTGEYDYICDVHPSQMKGTLVVVAEDAEG